MKRPFEETWAGKAAAWLETQQPGLQVTTVDLSIALGFTGKPETFSSCLRKARASCLRSVTAARHGEPTLWSLAKYEPVIDAQMDDDSIEWLPRRTSFPDIKPRPGMLFPGVYA